MPTSPEAEETDFVFISHGWAIHRFSISDLLEGKRIRTIDVTGGIMGH